MARPRPEDAPVMMATLSSSRWAEREAAAEGLRVLMFTSGEQD